MSASDRPGPGELRAFCAGALPAARAAAIDAWLAGLDEAAAERALAEAGVLDAPAPALAVEPPPEAGFIPDPAAGRLEAGARLGEGGMAVVGALRDRALERVVAVKVLRARRPDEPLDAYLLREAAFRREAALTAALEHPAIPPVYDVGRSDGRPAFAMRRLEGRSLEEAVRAGDLPLAARLEALLRVAEAVAFAHSRGVVHRDLTPRNILLAAYGAVYVLDWGLAAPAGAGAGVRAGTAAWMAPEQAAGAAADPRMDVFALGGLAAVALTGRGDGDGLNAPGVPRPLAALARRCLAADPARRYPDAGAVADDLRRWFAEGVTLAQEATRWELAWLRLRRSPRVRAALLAALAVLAVGAGAAWLAQRGERAEAEARLARIAATTSLERAETVAVALDEVRAIALRHPRLAAAAALAARLQAAHDLAERLAEDAAVRERLAGLLRRTRTLGPWADQVQDWRAAIAAAAGGTPALDAVRAEALAFLWRAERERGEDAAAAGTAAALAAHGPTPAWRALGRLLARSRFAAHDPVFCACEDAAGTLAEAGPTATALALYAPEPRLTTAARTALAARPGDFWPLIASARASLAEGDPAAAERLALVASGAEPASLLPPLLLAYAALARGDDEALALQVERGLAVDAGNSELTALRAVALARAGRRAEAQALVHRLDAGHLQYHLHHRVGHPMERSVDALVAAGLHIPDAPAELGPLVPHRH